MVATRAQFLERVKVLRSDCLLGRLRPAGKQDIQRPFLYNLAPTGPDPGLPWTRSGLSHLCRRHLYS